LVTVKRYYRGIRNPFVKRGWWRGMLFFTVTLFLLLLVRSFFFFQVKVSFPVPELGLLEGDRVIVDRTAYVFGGHPKDGAEALDGSSLQLQKGDWVVFKAPYGLRQVGMEKVTGLPGDTLWLDDNRSAYLILPDHTFGVGQAVLPDSCLIGIPVCVSYSLDSSRPFYRQLRLDRFFLWIE